jgi:hypothetical protein
MDGAERRCFTIQSLAKALPRESELLAESYLKACVRQATLERAAALAKNRPINSIALLVLTHLGVRP